ncbi:MAG: acetyl-CoA decarbonylase/synthase complex subunit delta [Peptococcaceae bacterium]|nr:acetyl-CoA decarbonylase/synthase complex subunit delta [Peptococcaceae bacterium]
MSVQLVRERWNGSAQEMTLGRHPHAVKVGGESTLPFLHFEGSMPNRPVLALEVTDTSPQDWPGVLSEPYREVMGDPVHWAMACEKEGADLVALKLDSCHPEKENADPEQAARTAAAVAEAINVPLIVLGCGDESKDAEVLPIAAKALQGHNCLLGTVTADNYKPVVAACIEYHHNVVATSPLDINLAKQLNILISDMDLPLHRIAMDPSIGPLGYGIEYAYSIIERMRIGALTGDIMLSPPVICMVGEEAWKTKEAQSSDVPEWGDWKRRAVLWEAVTASVLLQAGGHIMVLRHPESLALVKAQIDDLMRK